MKKILCSLFCMSALVACGNPKEDTTKPEVNDGTPRSYYISNSTGSDHNNGTSPNAPWKTLSRIRQETYHPGDSILLKSGDLWETTSTTIFNSKFTGTKELPIVMSSYGTGNRPRITTTGEMILQINNSDYFHIMNLDLGGSPSYGLLMSINDGKEHGNILVKNIHVHDMPNPGIFFNDSKNKDIEISSCTADNAMMLFAISGGENIKVLNSRAEFCNQGGISLIGVKNGLVDHCYISNCSGTLAWPQGTCGIFLGITDGIVISNTEISYQKRQGTDPDSEAIDFERNNQNVLVTGCYFHHNDGCGIMFFDSGDNVNQRNDNCIIENCIFEDNGQNCSAPCGFEINFTRPNNNNYGVIRNNTFKLLPGVRFANTTDKSVVIEGNKLSDGTPLVIAPAYDGTPKFLNHGFEEPAIGADFKHNPTGGSWSFRQNSGICGNGSAFGAPTAPEGTQVGFLQGASDITQFVSLPAGTYKLSCYTACRGEGSFDQALEIYVNDIKVGETIYPRTIAFVKGESATFTVGEGIHLIEMRTINNADKTIFLDEIKIVAVQ